MVQQKGREKSGEGGREGDKGQLVWHDGPARIFI